MLFFIAAVSSTDDEISESAKKRMEKVPVRKRFTFGKGKQRGNFSREPNRFGFAFFLCLFYSTGKTPLILPRAPKRPGEAKEKPKEKSQEGPLNIRKPKFLTELQKKQKEERENPIQIDLHTTSAGDKQKKTIKVAVKGKGGSQ